MAICFYGYTSFHRICLASTFCAVGLLSGFSADASETGHYVAGVGNMLDTNAPSQPGYYFEDMNYFYWTSRLNDSNGNKVDSVTLGPPPGVKVNISVDVSMYAQTPFFVWATNWTLFGARYSVYVAPSFANSNINAALSNATGRGLSLNRSQFDMGDIVINPLWLNWSFPHWDVSVAEGFYAPIGRYKTMLVTRPVIGTVRAESPDNIGLGFWTNQMQASVTYYPFPERGTAINVALTYEIHGKKKDFDLTPGQDLSLNWGVQQYLPLNKDGTLLLDAGPAGYCTWQISRDSGADATPGGIEDSVCAAGGQIGLTYVPLALAVNMHAFSEFESVDRFQGTTFGINIQKKL